MVSRAVQCSFSQQQALPWGSLSAPMTDEIYNPSVMFWVCPGFPPSLSCPEHFQREAPRHLNWLLSEELVAWHHGPPKSLSSSLWNVKWGQSPYREISSACIYDLYGEGPDQLQFKNTPVSLAKDQDTVPAKGVRIGDPCSLIRHNPNKWCRASILLAHHWQGEGYRLGERPVGRGEGLGCERVDGRCFCF